MDSPLGLGVEDVWRSMTNVRPSDAGIEQIENFREAAKELVQVLFDKIPPCRERSLAITHLEEVVMWGVKGICLNDPDAREIPIGEK